MRIMFTSSAVALLLMSVPAHALEASSECTVEAATSSLMAEALEKNSTIASNMKPLLKEEFTIIDSVPGEKNSSTAELLSKAGRLSDLERFSEDETKLTIMLGSQLIEDNYSRDLELINLMYMDVYREYMGQSAVPHLAPDATPTLKQQTSAMLYMNMLVMRMRKGTTFLAEGSSPDMSKCNMDVAVWTQELSALNAFQPSSQQSNTAKERARNFLVDLETLRIMFNVATIKRDAYRADIASGSQEDIFSSSAFLSAMQKRPATVGQTLKGRIDRHELDDNTLNALKQWDSLDALVPSDQECQAVQRIFAVDDADKNTNASFSKYDQCRNMEVWTLSDITKT